MGRIHFFTGPVRSGKSRSALALANAWGERPVYVATYLVDPLDLEMRDRVEKHKRERSDKWRTIEAPTDLISELELMDPPPSGLMFDCLTLWLSFRLEKSDEYIFEAWENFLTYLREAPFPSVIVSNEVGWSILPIEPELRRFRDLSGWLGQTTAKIADEAWLCVAGYPIRLK